MKSSNLSIPILAFVRVLIVILSSQITAQRNYLKSFCFKPEKMITYCRKRLVIASKSILKHRLLRNPRILVMRVMSGTCLRKRLRCKPTDLPVYHSLPKK